MTILESTDLLLEKNNVSFPELEKKYSEKEIKQAYNIATKKKGNVTANTIEQIIKDLST